MKTSLEFLGHEVTAAMMVSTKEKLKAMKECERPRDVTSLRSFLGFANYYWRYVQNFAQLANPLTELSKKGMPFQWGPYQRRAFAQLKDALYTTPILQYLDPFLPYVVVMDASHFAVGGILMQDHGDGLRPLAFLSRQLKPIE